MILAVSLELPHQPSSSHLPKLDTPPEEHSNKLADLPQFKDTVVFDMEEPLLGTYLDQLPLEDKLAGVCG
jgi:hypothetical protein